MGSPTKASTSDAETLSASLLSRDWYIYEVDSLLQCKTELGIGSEFLPGHSTWNRLSRKRIQPALHVEPTSASGIQGGWRPSDVTPRSSCTQEKQSEGTENNCQQELQVLTLMLEGELRNKLAFYNASTKNTPKPQL